MDILGNCNWKVNINLGNKHNSNDYDVIIVGAGIGGLTGGALLAKRGYKTLLLECNHLLGGFCSSTGEKLELALVWGSYGSGLVLEKEIIGYVGR